MQKERFKQKFFELINKSNNIAIITHKRPDHDAIGSTVGLQRFLKTKFNKKIRVFIEGPKLDSWDWFLEDDIEWVDSICNEVNAYDLIVCLDANEFKRFTEKFEELKNILSKKTTICIDHHKSKPSKFNLTYIDFSHPSASSIIYELFLANEIGFNNTLLPIAVGILGDTGWLRFINKDSSKIFGYMEQILPALETNLQQIDLYMGRLSKNELVLISKIIENTKYGSNYSYSFLDLNYLDSYKSEEISMANHKYMASFLSRIENYSWGFVVTPKSEKIISVSFRSTPSFPNVRLIAEHFKGGGHDLASGAEFEVSGEIKDSKDVCKKIIEYIDNIELVNA